MVELLAKLLIVSDPAQVVRRSPGFYAVVCRENAWVALTLVTVALLASASDHLLALLHVAGFFIALRTRTLSPTTNSGRTKMS